jgi:hypothetical protein
MVLGRIALRLLKEAEEAAQQDRLNDPLEADKLPAMAEPAIARK